MSASARSVGTTSSVMSGRIEPWVTCTTGRSPATTSATRPAASSPAAGPGAARPPSARSAAGAGAGTRTPACSPAGAASARRPRRAPSRGPAAGRARRGSARRRAARPGRPPAADRADQPVAQPADRTAHRQQAGPERRRVRLQYGSGPSPKVAYGTPVSSPSMPTPYISPSCSIASTGRSASTGRRSATRCGAWPTKTSANARPMSRGPRRPANCGKTSVDLPAAEVGRAPGTGSGLGADRGDALVEGAPGVPEHLVAALDQPGRERHRVRGVGRHRDAGEQEAGHRVSSG